MRRQIRLILDSLLLGVVGGLSAQLFIWLLRVANNFFLTQIAGYQAPGVAADGGVLHAIPDKTIICHIESLRKLSLLIFS